MINEEQVKKYLERIGLDHTPALTEAGLDELIWANLTHIPFENVQSALKHEVPSLEESDIYTKIVENHNGGYCFELNKLFLSLLKTVGFHAWTVAVRIVWQKPAFPPALHRASIIKIDDRLFLADVGYGGPGPKGVIELKDGIVQIRGSRFRVSIPEEGKWLIEREYQDDFSPMLLFEEREADETDYILMNFYCARCDKVIFSHTLVCSILTEDGSISLTDHKLTIKKGPDVIDTILDSDESLNYAIKTYFQLTHDLM